MNLEENTQSLEAAIENDLTGMEDIQNAINEIEKLKENDDFNNEENDENIETELEETPEEIKKPEIEKKQDKTWKLKRDKYEALAKKEEAERRVIELEGLLNESLNASTYHYGKSAYNDLERAKINKKIAIENGDTEAFIVADEALYRALHAVTELEKFNNQERNEPTYKEDSSQQYESVYNEIAQDWLESHPELEPSSGQYNKHLAKGVANFVNVLNNDLNKNNRMDLFFSEQYFDTINEYIDTLNNEAPKEVSPNRSTTINSHVGGVRNSYNSGGSVKSSTQITLSSDEKRMCSDLGLSEKDWIKYKLEEIKTGKRV